MLWPPPPYLSGSHVCSQMSDLRPNWTEKASLRFELQLAASWLLMHYFAAVTSGLFFSREGIFPLDTLQKYLEPGCWSLNFLNEALWWQGAMLVAEAVAGLSLMAGYFSSISCFVAWVIWISILRRTEPAANAGDYLDGLPFVLGHVSTTR